LLIKFASGLTHRNSMNSEECAHSMFDIYQQLSKPFAGPTVAFFQALAQGRSWSEAVLTEAFDYTPLYRAHLAALIYFADTDKLIEQVQILCGSTHDNSKITACAIAAAHAVTYILTYRNKILRHDQQLIGGSPAHLPVWDDAEFIKSISLKAAIYCPETAEHILELLIYSALPADRYFDMVGISENALETLLSSLYCFLKHREHFQKALVLALNARGSIKSVTGNRLGITSLTGFLSGAYNGYVQIPHPWINGLLLKETVLETATELYTCYYKADRHDG
jgi:ADP-ribosylglycohydrolase